MIWSSGSLLRRSALDMTSDEMVWSSERLLKRSALDVTGGDIGWGSESLLRRGDCVWIRVVGGLVPSAS